MCFNLNIKWRNNGKIGCFLLQKNDSDFKLLKKNKRINKINGRNICTCCICLNEIVVRADMHL